MSKKQIKFGPQSGDGALTFREVREKARTLKEQPNTVDTPVHGTVRDFRRKIYDTMMCYIDFVKINRWVCFQVNP
jgi:hypothetical protein